LTPTSPDDAFDVLCIGNAIVDVLANVDDAFVVDHGMVKGTMQLIDDATAEQLYADMPPALESSGGSAANTAAGLASFGGKVAFIGRVADDQLGKVFTHDIRALGVAYSPPSTTAEPATARCLILVNPDAERTLNTFLGASSLIGPDDVDVDIVARAQILFCEGYLWDLPEAKAALLKAMKAAGEAGNKVAFSLSDRFCVDRHRDEFLELAEKHVDILFANEDEICALYEVDDFDDAAARVAAHCELACLTRGGQGSVIVSAGADPVVVAPEPAAQLVDTTGAGDLYASGFLFGLTHGHNLAESGRLASLAAAEVISHIGARPEIDLKTLLV
jgi:sugar/nucleoside kinase (ribokinase family)